jgi:hypothetical protein
MDVRFLRCYLMELVYIDGERMEREVYLGSRGTSIGNKNFGRGGGRQSTSHINLLG